MDLQTDGEGFLLNRADWTPDVAKAIAAEDGVELSTQQMEYIMAARSMFEAEGTVPPLRKFIKQVGISKADLFSAFHTGPMKLICKWGGLPKPTGCV
jgi:tRNA 2-thiouridine synthesizing protein E